MVSAFFCFFDTIYDIVRVNKDIFMRKSSRKTAQDIQDSIFRKMSAERKIEVGS